MKILFYSVLVVVGIGGVIAARLDPKHRAIRFILLLLCGSGIFATAGRELYALSDGFKRPLADYLGINLLVPVGWFLTVCLVFLFAFVPLNLDQGRSIN